MMRIISVAVLVTGLWLGCLQAQSDTISPEEKKAGIIAEKLPGLTFRAGEFKQSLSLARAAILDDTFQSIFTKSKAHGMRASVFIPGEGSWHGVAGVEDRQLNKSITLASQFHAGSIGKMITAVLILDLIQQNRFSLQDKLSRWMPDVPGANSITLDHLLSHTSGLPGNLLNETSHRAGQLQESLKPVMRQKRLFEPGHGFSYSNPGYMSLGLILEHEYGQPLSDIVEQHFLRKHQFKQSTALTAGNQEHVLVRSTHQGKPGSQAIDYASVGGAGMLATTSSDLIEMLHRLLTHQLLDRDTTHLMLSKMFPMDTKGQLHWGRGLMVLDMPLGRMYYLAGRIKGFGAMVGYLPKSNTYVSVMVNDDTQVEPVMFALLQSVVSVKK